MRVINVCGFVVILMLTVCQNTLGQINFTHLCNNTSNWTMSNLSVSSSGVTSCSGNVFHDNMWSSVSTASAARSFWSNGKALSYQFDFEAEEYGSTNNTPVNQYDVFLQYSTDGVNYSTVGTMEKTTSDGCQTKTFFHRPASGTIYYRIFVQWYSGDFDVSIDNIIVSQGVNNTWDGSTDSDWNDAANWSKGTVPDRYDDVTIANVSNTPSISAYIECADLTVESGATLNISSSDSLRVEGSLTVQSGGSISNTSDCEIQLFGRAGNSISGEGTVSSVDLRVRGEYSLPDSWSLDRLHLQDAGTVLTVATGETLTLGNTFYNNENCSLILDGTASMVVNGQAWMAHHTGSVFTINSGTLDLNHYGASSYNNLVGEGTFNANSSTIYCAGNLRANSGTFNSGTSTVVLDGANNTLIRDNEGFSFYNLIIQKDATDDEVTCYDADSDITVTNNLTINEGTFAPTLGVLSVSGDVTINDGKYVGIDQVTDIAGNLVMNNDAVMDCQATDSTAQIKITGSISLNGTSGIQSTTNTEVFVLLRGASKTITVNTAANSSTGNFLIQSGADYQLNNDWSVAKFHTNGGVGGTFSVADGLTFTVNKEFYTRDNSVFTLTGPANLILGEKSWLAHGENSVFNLNTGYIDHNYTGTSFSVNICGSNGTFNANSGTFYTQAALFKCGGTFNYGTSTFIFDGPNNTEIGDGDGITFYDVQINKSSGEYLVNTNSADDDIIIANNLLISEGSLSPLLADLTVNGNVRIDGGSYIHNNANLIVNGNITLNNDGVFSSGGAGDIDLYGTSIDINGTAGFSNINDSDQMIEVHSSTEVTVETTAKPNSSSARFNFRGNNSTHNINDNWDLHYFETMVTSSGTVTFNVISGKTITTEIGCYNRTNCTINLLGTAGYTQTRGTGWICQEASSVFNLNDGVMDINGGSLLIGNSGNGTFNANSGTVQVGGNVLLMDGTINEGSSVFNFDGTTDVSVYGTTLKFHDVSFNNSGGNINLLLGASVTGTLTFNNGDLNITTGQTLSIDGTDTPGISGGSASSHIITNGTATLSDVYASTSKITYPLGDGTNYRPIGIMPTTANSQTWTLSYIPSAHGDTDVDESGLAAVSNQEYWNIDRSGSVNANLEFTWTSNNGVLDYTDLAIAHYDGTTDWDMITSTPTGDNNSGTIISDGPVSTFSPFTLGSKTLANVLPVDLLSFDVELNEHVVDLIWVTASEWNNDFFEIQRSSDALTWEVIGFLSGNGTTSQINTYESQDFSPLSGESFYRLRQVDFDGSYEYSAIKRVEKNSIQLETVFYPNFLESGRIIYFQNTTKNQMISIYNSVGQLIINRPIREEINVMNLTPGQYFVQIDNNPAKKLLIQ